MNKYAILFALTAVGGFACGDNHNSTDAAGGSDSKTADAGVPAPPALGAQIDRMGRPAINTALNHTFDTTSAKGPAKDTYNEQSDPTMWQNVTNVDQFEANLAIFDALDTKCGNQVEYNKSPTGGGTAAADSYDTLATILADDELYLDSTQTKCDLYLAAEFNVVVGAQMFNDCGGRAPSYDVIDVTYSAVAVGLTGFTINGQQVTPLVGDGVSAHAGVSDTNFPFLAAPH